MSDTKSLPYDTNSVEKVHASDILEHFPWAQVPDVLREWYRVLKEGGVLTIKTPNLETLLNHLAGFVIQGGFSSSITTLTPAHPQPPEVAQMVIRKIFGGQESIYDYHKSGFTPKLIKALLHSAGFKEVKITEKMNGDDWSNMGIKAVK